MIAQVAALLLSRVTLALLKLLVFKKLELKYWATTVN